MSGTEINMVILKVILMILITAVVVEFGVHVVYHAVTGRAGLYDPPFDYLRDIFKKEG